MKGHGLLTAVALAAVLTGLNATKPLMMDDTAYYHLARQIVDAPGDPYGFAQYWYERPQPANEVLAPPVFPYWLALSMTLFGDDPVAWKLALFPFALLLTLALRELCDRFTPGLTSLLLPLTVLSPVVLPAFNLMLDVPVLALSLTAAALFLCGVDRDAWRQVVLAGLLAGLAMQTKYTAFILPGVLLSYAALSGRLRWGIVAVSVALALFVGWEWYTAHGYGVSHCWYHVTKPRDPNVPPRTRLLLPLVAYLGGLAPAVLFVGLAGLQRWRLVTGGILVVVAGYFLLALVPDESAVFLRSDTGREFLSLNSLLFGSLGLATLAVSAVVLRVLLWRQTTESGWLPSLRGSLDTRFLASWFALEFAGYFALSPFPAARRLQGLIVVGTLVAGRLAALRCRTRTARHALGAATLLGVALGFGYFAVDWADAHLEPDAARQAATAVHEKDPDAAIWFLGTWGFKYYAEQLGMQHFVPGQSTLRTGDWLVLVPRDGIPPKFQPPPEQFAWRGQIEIASRVPLHTWTTYYGGHRPLEHVWPKKLVLNLYQFVPSGTRPTESPETVATDVRSAAPAGER